MANGALSWLAQAPNNDKNLSIKHPHIWKLKQAAARGKNDLSSKDVIMVYGSRAVCVLCIDIGTILKQILASGQVVINSSYIGE